MVFVIDDDPVSLVDWRIHYPEYSISSSYRDESGGARKRVIQRFQTVH